MDTRETFTAQMDAELEGWKHLLDDAPREVLLVLAIAVLLVLQDKYNIRIERL